MAEAETECGCKLAPALIPTNNWGFSAEVIAGDTEAAQYLHLHITRRPSAPPDMNTTTAPYLTHAELEQREAAGCVTWRTS